MQINVSSRKGNLRHTGLMHGMQIHDALLKKNYRGRCEAVSSDKHQTRWRWRVCDLAAPPRRPIAVIRAGQASAAIRAASATKIPGARRCADARNPVAPNAGSDGPVRLSRA